MYLKNSYKCIKKELRNKKKFMVTLILGKSDLIMAV